MITVTPENGSIDLGRQGENLARRVVLPLEDLAAHAQWTPGRKGPAWSGW